MKFKVLDLFSGIGGFSLGLERTGGFETVAFCEIEEFPRRVLAKHWPGVPIYDDVRTLTAERLAADGIAVDVICGGFPCQDISIAGARVGLAGERSGLWSEYARLVGEVRPQYVLVENVANLLTASRGEWFGQVLGDLAALGYDAEWHCIPASHVGAPHQRDRLWIVAHADKESNGKQHSHAAQRRDREVAHHGVADADRAARAQPLAVQQRIARAGNGEADGGERCPRPHNWSCEPDVARVAHGVPGRLDRNGALGNAVVPQIPELIGHAILQAEAEHTTQTEELSNGC